MPSSACPIPIVGFNLNTADAWAAGDGNLSGTWPTVWYHTSDVPASKTFVANFIKKNGKPPENHAWIEYVSLKMMAQAMNETKSTDTDKLIAYFEKETQFDILKGRKGYFRTWDHQLMQEAYPFTVKAKGKAKDKWDMLELGARDPRAERIARSHRADQGAEPLLDVTAASSTRRRPAAGRAPGDGVYRRTRRQHLVPSGIDNAVRVPAGTGGEWPRARRLLSPDRARPVADLQRRRRGQSRPWRVLCARRLCLGRDHKISRLRPGGRAVADRGGACSASCSSASSCAASTPPIRSSACS